MILSPSPSQKTQQNERREQEPRSSHHPITSLQWQWHCSLTHTPGGRGHCWGQEWEREGIRAA